MSRARRLLGGSGEERAAAYLERQGLAVLDRGFSCALGELDIVAREGETIVFVEVKTRSSESFGPAELAVGPRKQARMARAALLWLRARRLAGPPLRFDVVCLQGGELRHVRDAFQAPGYTI